MTAGTLLSQRFPVLSFMVDTEDQLSLTGMCRILQDAAWKHATALGFGPSELGERGLIWILSRLHARLSYYPRWGEEITIVTWPSGVERLFALRDFRLTSGSGRPLALVRSAWLAVDAVSRRPAPPSRLMDGTLYRDAERVFDDLPPRLEPVDGNAPAAGRHTVVYSDFDRQRHVNNVQYLQWMLDVFPMEHLTDNSAAELSINFHAEAAYGESVVIRRRDEGPVSDVGVFREQDGSSICSAHITWRARSGS